MNPKYRSRGYRTLLAVTLLFALLCAALPTMAFAEQPNEPIRYGYTTAAGNVRYVYDQLVSGVMRNQPLETLSLDSQKGVTEEEVRAAVTLFLSDYPECFWMRNGYSFSHTGTTVVSISPNYAFMGSELVAARAALDAEVDRILADLPSGDTHAKALYLHDAVAKRTEYIKVGEHQTAYGALVSGKAVCAGYAAAYHLLLRKAGIAAWTVSGSSRNPATGESIPHAWNLVWLDENTCVYTDVTWDDQGDTLYHAYFQISLAEMETDHVVDTAIFSLPSCNHSGQSYFDRLGGNITDPCTPESLAALFGAVRNGARSAAFRYTGASDFSQWLNTNHGALYQALGGLPGAYSYSMSSLGNEIQLTILGSFDAETASDTESETESITESETESESETTTETESVTELESVTETARDEGTESGSEPVSDNETDHGSETETQTDSETDHGSETETRINSETGDRDAQTTSAEKTDTSQNTDNKPTDLREMFGCASGTSVEVSMLCLLLVAACCIRKRTKNT
ncbi:MAG: hypothetical protein E7666_02305 [Ruminococcaceae bacterium]|nr:hypothetical protein [Oscillospiraceae bacterium]